MQKPASCRGGPEDARGAGDVPASVVVRGINRVADAAFGFNPVGERGYEIGAGNGLVFGQRQNCGTYRARRVNDGSQVGIVEIQHMAGNAIKEGGVKDIGSLFATQQTGLGGAEEGRERGQSVGYGFIL